MIDLTHAENQILCVSSFQDLIDTPFQGSVNAMCWTRKLTGDFAEIVNQIELDENIVELDTEELHELKLSEQGQLARTILLNDLHLLKELGAAPVLNLIKYYDRDEDFPFFPTDVYSYHVDRSPLPTDTFLCTYYGEPSDIIANSQVTQKVLVPEIREKLLKLYNGPLAGFESFLTENFFDLHYQANKLAQPTNLGLGHLWKIATDHPQSKVLPCVHRAPKETNGQTRLLMIC